MLGGRTFGQAHLQPPGGNPGGPAAGEGPAGRCFGARMARLQIKINKVAEVQ